MFFIDFYEKKNYNIYVDTKRKIQMTEKKRGRPPVNGQASDKTLHIRMTAEEFERLNAFVKKTGKTKSDIVRNALVKVMDDEK